MEKIMKKIIIAHRGASAYANENTVESLKKAIASGADMIEFDVRRTKDNVFIVYHDEFIQDKSTRELTCKDIDRIGQNQGFDILTVEEVLKCTSGKIKLDVELKEEGYEKEITELVLKFFKEDEFVITSFNDSSLKVIKDNYPNIKVGLLLGKKKPKNIIVTILSELFSIKRCIKAKADFLVPHRKLLRFGFLKRAKRNDKPVFVWTVNDKKLIWKLLNDKRIDAIITDKPDLAVLLWGKIASTTYRSA